MLQQKGFTKGLQNKGYMYCVRATECNKVSNVFRTILVVFSETTSINIWRRGNLTWYKQITYRIQYGFLASMLPSSFTSTYFLLVQW
jgi:hypothetical protein